jgi:hypothetical protein
MPFQGAIADYDPPGPPELFVIVWVDKITLNPHQNDGNNNMAEVELLAIGFANNHWHTTTIKTWQNTYNSKITWDLLNILFIHSECTEMAGVYIAFQVYEIDVIVSPVFWGNVNNFIQGILNGVSSAVDFALPPGVNAPPNQPGKAASDLIFNRVLPRLSVVFQDLGKNSDYKETAGFHTLTTSGSDGSAVVDWIIDVTDQGSTPKCPPSGTGSSQSPPSDDGCCEPPGNNTVNMMGATRNLIDSISEIEIEPGNPGDIDQAEFDEWKETLPFEILGSLDYVLNYMIDMGPDLPDIWHVQNLASEANASAIAGDIDKALDLYEAAYLSYELQLSVAIAENRTNDYEEYVADLNAENTSLENTLLLLGIALIAVIVIATLAVLITWRRFSKK